MIRTFLIRYGNLGRIGWFGTVHTFPLRRGDRVVVQSIDGLWLGTILQLQAPGSAGVARGELLRVAAHEDLAAWVKLKQEIPGIVRVAGEALAKTGVAASILDGDLSFDRHVLILQFAGQATDPISATLGPLADKLAIQFQVARTQWLGVNESTVADLEAVDHEVGSQPLNSNGKQISEGAEPDLAGRMIAGMRALDAGLLRDEALKRFANRNRGQLGLAGLYLQRYRSEPDSRTHQPPDSPATAPLASAPLATGHRGTRRWMVRLKTAAGRMTVGQFRGLIDFAVRYGDGTLRLTMRQGIQFHGVAEGHAVELLDSIASLAMTSRGSCGNSLRNVTCCPLEPVTKLQQQAKQLAANLTRLWLPAAGWLDVQNWKANVPPGRDGSASDAGHASWFDWQIEADCPTKPTDCKPTDWDVAEASLSAGQERTTSNYDSSYPDGYLAHKWKIAVATADHNCVNLRANDLGIALRKRSSADTPVGVGFEDARQYLADIWIGGGLAYRTNKAGTFPQLAVPFGAVAIQDVEAVVAGLIELHKSVATTTDDRGRHNRRFKYLVNRLGADAIAKIITDTKQIRVMPLESELDPQNDSPRDAWPKVADLAGHASVSQSADGRWQCVAEVVAGRLRFDTPETLAAWVQLLELCRFVAVGPQHTLVFGGLSETAVSRFSAICHGSLGRQLQFHNTANDFDSSHGRFADQRAGQSDQAVETEKLAGQPRLLTCVGLPTCPLAVAAAEGHERTWSDAAAAAEPTLRLLVDAAKHCEVGTRPGRRLTFAVSGCSNNCSLPLLADVGIVAESGDRFLLLLGGTANELGTPIGILAGPEQLGQVSETLLSELQAALSRGNSVQDWLRQKRVSRNFAWPRTEN